MLVALVGQPVITLCVVLAYEQAVRDQKMRIEMSQAKRENSHYLSSVEKSKEIEAIVGRKRKRGATEEEVCVCVCVC